MIFRYLLTIAFIFATSATPAGDVVKVFILAGQSNMQGAGKIKAEEKANQGKGSLEWLVRDSETAPKFKHLVNERGEWVVRDDVQIWYLDRKGGLAPGFGAREETIGPELGFGHVVGNAFSEPVLLIKLAWGGKSLAKDFRPPSSGGETGSYYKDVIKLTREVMTDAATLFPQFADHNLELAGF
ncbi:MAG: sialate O-acetylesterase, partial [Rhodopirellula sp.]|nr:sialate O-acetylesterase [Rhodopirellula sp.]